MSASHWEGGESGKVREWRARKMGKVCEWSGVAMWETCLGGARWQVGKGGRIGRRWDRI